MKVIEDDKDKIIEELKKKINTLEDELFRYKLFKLRAVTRCNTRKCANALMLNKNDYIKAEAYLKVLINKHSTTLM